MAAEDDQTKWRTVFCKDSTNMQVTTWPEADQPHTVVQPDPAELKCTNTPDGVTAQEVTQLDAVQFNVTNTPTGETSQPVHHDTTVRGIWPAATSARVNKSGYVSGVARTILYTVPENKKLYISGMSLASRNSAEGDSYIRIEVEYVTTAIKYQLTSHYYRIPGHLASGGQNIPALEAVANEVVVVRGYLATVSGRANIYGWLEDA